MKIAGATLNQTPLDWKNNIKNIVSAIRQAKKEGIELLALPELALTGYGCQDVFLSKWIYEKSLEILLDEIIPETAGIAVNIGLPLHFEHTNYNTSCFIINGEIQGFTSKQCLANDGVHYEKRWFTGWEPGRKETLEIGGHPYPFGDIVYEFKGKKIAFEICEDAWCDARPAYSFAKQNVDYIINPSASHFAFGKTITRENLVISSSKNFNCTYIYTNLLGNEAGRMIYDGEILIAKEGKLLAKNELLSFHKINILSTESKERPTYTKNEEFLLADQLALYDYMRKSFSKGFVLSLSGGADSSTCAVLVAEMLKTALKQLPLSQIADEVPFLKPIINAEKFDTKNPYKELIPHLLSCAYQGTVNSGEITLNASQELALQLGAEFHDWKIDTTVNHATETIEKVLNRKLTWETDDIALQNIQARARSPYIWMLTNTKGALLITTSNRSEGGMGYATMDGDTSGGIAPISGVDKPFIRQWLRWAETNLGYSALSFVNILPPTAELRPQETAQTDEDDLMPYDLMVQIERLAIGQYQSPEEVFENLKPSNLTDEKTLKTYINKFFRIWSITQWKRERLAPSFHLDDFNVDPKTWYRFPILSGGFEQLK